MTAPEGRIIGDRALLLSAVVPHAVLERAIAEYLVAPAPLPERSSFGASPRCLLKADVIKGQRSDIPSSDPRSYLAARIGGWMPALAVLVAPFPPHRQLALHRTVVVQSDHDMAALTAASRTAADSGVESLMVCGRGVTRDALEQLRSNGPLLSALTSISIDPEACPELFPIPPSLRSYRRLIAERAFKAFKVDDVVSDEGENENESPHVEEMNVPRGCPWSVDARQFDTNDYAEEQQRILHQRSTTRTLMQILTATPHLTRLDVPLCPEPLLVIRGIEEHTAAGGALSPAALLQTTLSLAPSQRSFYVYGAVGTDVVPIDEHFADIARKRSRSGSDHASPPLGRIRTATAPKVSQVPRVKVCGLTSLTLRTGDPSLFDDTIRSWCKHGSASSVHFSPRAVKDILAHLPLLESLDVCLSLCDSPYSPEIIAAVTGPHCAVDIPYLCGGEDMAGTADISDHDVWHMHVAMANHAHRLEALTFTCECGSGEWFPFTVPHHGMRSFMVTNSDLPCGFDMARTLPNLTHLDAPFDFSEPDPDPASWPYLKTLRLRCLFDRYLIGLLVLLRHCPLVSLSLVDDITSFETPEEADLARPTTSSDRMPRSVARELRTLLSRSLIVATLRHLHIEHWATFDATAARMFSLESLNVVKLAGEVESLPTDRLRPLKRLALLGNVDSDSHLVELAVSGVASRLVRLDLSHYTDFDDDTDFPHLTDLGCVSTSLLPRRGKVPALSTLHIRYQHLANCADQFSTLEEHSSLRHLLAELPDLQNLPVLPHLESLTIFDSLQGCSESIRTLLQWNESDLLIRPELRRCSRVCTDVFEAGGGLPPNEAYGTLEAFDSPLLRMPSLAHLSVPFLFFDPKGFAAYLCRHLEALHTVKCRDISIV